MVGECAEYVEVGPMALHCFHGMHSRIWSKYVNYDCPKSKTLHLY